MNDYRKTGIVLQKADGLKMACHQAAVVERRSTIYEAQDILGVAHTTLRSQLDPNQTKSIPLDTVRVLHWLTRDRRIERQLLWPGLWAVPDLDCLIHSGDPDKEIGDVHIRLGRLQQNIRLALEDGQISPQERKELWKLYVEADNEWREIGALIQGKGGPKGAKE